MLPPFGHDQRINPDHGGCPIAVSSGVNTRPRKSRSDSSASGCAVVKDPIRCSSTLLMTPVKSACLSAKCR